MVVELAISGVGGKASHSEGASRLKENKVAFVGIRENSWLPHLSNGDVASFRGGEHQDTSSSPRASVISIPEFLHLYLYCDSFRA